MKLIKADLKLVDLEVKQESMELTYINNGKYMDEIEKLYLEAFPKDERFPFWILEECSKENNSDLYAFIDNDKFIGMCYIVNCVNAYYLMYLAVEPNLRNKNYGSKILSKLKEKYQLLFLSIDEPNDSISIRRKNFYLKNGFYDINRVYEDTGINYEILCTDDRYEITDNIMKMRYTNMTNNSKILNEISNTFNVNGVNIKIKNEVSNIDVKFR